MRLNMRGTMSSSGLVRAQVRRCLEKRAKTREVARALEPQNDLAAHWFAKSGITPKIGQVTKALEAQAEDGTTDECTACGEPLPEVRQGKYAWCEDCEARMEAAFAKD